jgi:CubicO group peptidase (beta-lactamase class C family)
MSPTFHASGLDRRAFVAVAAGAAAFAGAPAAAQVQQRAPKAAPGQVNTGSKKQSMSEGLSKARLARMHDVMAGHVAGGRMPGLVAAVSRHGDKQVDAIGTSAFEGNAAMRRDSIFRIASMSKPIAAAAAMILVEESMLRLDEPVDKWLPELANRKVLRAIDAALDDTVPAKRAITPRDLLTLRLGIGAVMAYPPQYPVQKAMMDAGVAPSAEFGTVPPDEFMKRIGSLPLIYQPGERFLYHTGLDILGVLIARATGTSLGAFLQERIFAPLGMKDTAFYVPEAKLDRLVTCYWADTKTGERTIFDPPRGRFARPPAMEAGGAGLVSTADDYLAFGRMLLGKGKHRDVRILSRPSVELMMTDQLTAEQKVGAELFFGEHRGWGFGGAVYTKRDDLSAVPGRYGWDGGYGTSAYVDPKEDLIGVLLTQRLMESPEPPQAFVDFWTQAYAAIDD